MTERSDADLLQSWSTEGSEKAFAELARRYGGLIYHASLRQTGRGDLAQEAAQNALLILARKAKGLGEVPSLAGWLHRTACYEAAKLLRRERRHDARMKQMPVPDSPDDGEHGWLEAAPLLDQALDSLPPKDRDLIFLRFFQNLSFEEIAQRCGGESTAWRKRSSRAMEKLRLALTKRGVALSGSALVTGLGTSLSQAAPPAVMATLTASPAAGAAALSWTTLASHSLHLMKLHPATAVIVTLLLTALPLSVQAFANAAARDRIALLEAGQGRATGQASVARGIAPAATAKVSKQSILWLADQISKGSGSRQSGAAVKRMLRSLNAEELDQLLREAIAVNLPSTTLQSLLGQVLNQTTFSTTSPLPPERFLETLALLADHLDTKGQELVWAYSDRSIKKWVEEDPEKAVAWYRSEVKSGRFDFTRLNLLIPGELYASLRKADPQAAEDFYATLTEDERIPVIQLFKRSGTPEELLDLAAKFEDPAKRQVPLLTKFQYGTKDKSPAEVRAWVDRAGVSGTDAAALLAAAAEGDPYREDGGVQYYSGMKTDQIAERIAWLHDPAMGGESSAAIGIFLASSMTSAPEQTREALTAEWERHPDQEMLEAYFRHAGASFPGVIDALDRYRQLEDRENREELLRELLKTPAGQEVLAKMNREGVPAKDLEEAELPTELFR
ncbi:sigma-70 family RNA polymerase sigma factor [Haloferula sp. BvORR071]|uniref:RNA polymerase sigma factor n=1 Tax=Haloferula sp. BvORR071 TaxID=1396141 RepID=UPI0005510CBB|nr:sigma-70 family RNA polymerase sigma factor [Haloferula sp. BvORR071]